MRVGLGEAARQAGGLQREARRLQRAGGLQGRRFVAPPLDQRAAV